MDAYGIQRTMRDELFWLGAVQKSTPCRLLWTRVEQDALWFARQQDAEIVRALLHDARGPLGRVSRSSTRVERLGAGCSYGPVDFRPDWPLVSSLDELRRVGLAATTWRVGVRVASWEDSGWAYAGSIALDDAGLVWLRFRRAYMTETTMRPARPWASAPQIRRMWHVEYGVVFSETLGATGFGKPLEV